MQTVREAQNTLQFREAIQIKIKEMLTLNL